MNTVFEARGTAGQDQSQQGSLLVLTSLLLLCISLICISYWELIRYQTKMVKNRREEIKSFYAARAGAEDAIFEIKLGHDWSVDSFDLSSSWKHVSDHLFLKSTSIPDSLAISDFGYPVTYSVSVVGDPDTETVNIVSTSEIYSGGKTYTKRLNVDIVRSVLGDIHVVSVKE